MYKLERFIKAQNESPYENYERALSEMRAGKKQSHWIWYIFPQLKDLGRSDKAKYYGIENLDEAKEYLAHPVLSKRLIEISEAILKLSKNNPVSLMNGQTDATKLKSCMTLFAYASGDKDSVFCRVLEKFFDGQIDEKTMSIIEHEEHED
ncbi:MAG: DUF1810 domain-containing protein [Synergistaceae bacterium]|nr:DUF1810 domain-containing protein [Synergistaceae bacterium]